MHIQAKGTAIHLIAKLKQWLEKYKDKNIIMVTHFVTFSKFVQFEGVPSWDFFNAMMGSKRFGELALTYGVKKSIFGHVHVKYHEQYEGIELICNPLGYYPHEWDNESAEKEIYSAIKIIKI